MKKIIVFISGLLLAMSVNAATITVDGVTGSTVMSTDNVTKSQGTLPVEFSLDYLVSVSEDAFSTFDVAFTQPNGAPTDVNVVGYSIFDGTNTITTLLGTVQAFDFGYLLLVDMEYIVTLFGSSTISPTQVTLISSVPVPAALFLFAPALLGFIGLRRKATTIAA